MPRPVTMFTGQWADLPLEELAKKFKSFGYDGLELACWGDHFQVDLALAEPDYCERKPRIAGAQRAPGLGDQQSPGRPGRAGRDRLAAPGHPAALRLGRRQSGRRQRAGGRGNEERGPAAQKLGVTVVNGFTGSSIWQWLYSFPPVSPQIDRRRLQAAGRALEPDPRRVRRMRREVRPGSPSHGDRLRSRTRPSGPWKPSDIARSSASTSIPAI